MVQSVPGDFNQADAAKNSTCGRIHGGPKMLSTSPLRPAAGGGEGFFRRPVDGGMAIPIIPHLDAAPSGTARDTAPPVARRPAPPEDAAETGRVRFGSQ